MKAVIHFEDTEFGQVQFIVAFEGGTFDPSSPAHLCAKATANVLYDDVAQIVEDGAEGPLGSVNPAVS